MNELVYLGYPLSNHDLKFYRYGEPRELPITQAVVDGKLCSIAVIDDGKRYLWGVDLPAIPWGETASIRSTPDEEYMHWAVLVDEKWYRRSDGIFQKLGLANSGGERPGLSD